MPALTHEEYNSPKFSYRLLFKKKLVNRPGQADRVIEFIDPKSDLAKTIDKEYWVKKEVEREKYRPRDVVREVQKAGFAKFRICPEHVDMWKAEDAKNAAKGYGVNVAGQWYWYDLGSRGVSNSAGQRVTATNRRPLAVGAFPFACPVFEDRV